MEQHKQYNLESSKAFDNPGANSSDQDFISSANVLKTSKTISVKDFHILGDSEFETKRGQKFGRTPFSTLVLGSVYSLATTDYLLGITSLSYAPSVGLPRPSLVGPGKNFIIKDEVGGAATTTITVRSAGEENIDGAATSIITTNYGLKRFYTDGANWFTS